MTFNCNLGRDFTNATLTLCGLGGSPTHRQFQQAYAHRAGRCLLHKGRHRHGAEDIASGERQNLVIWNTNYKYRKSKRFRKDQAFREEVAPPDPRCLRCTAPPHPYPILTSSALILTSSSPHYLILTVSVTRTIGTIHCSRLILSIEHIGVLRAERKPGKPHPNLTNPHLILTSSASKPHLNLTSSCHRGKAWCPPESACYDSMQPEPALRARRLSLDDPEL